LTDSKSSSAETKSIVEHRRVVEREPAVVGREDRSEIRRAEPSCRVVDRIVHPVDFKRDDALAALATAAQ